MLRKTARKKEKQHRFHFAMPQSLFDKLEKMAHDNNRSVTSQIISALQWTTREVKLDESQQPDADVR